MFRFLNNWLGANPEINMDELLARGATIVDVRTGKEFSRGHVKGSINIPLDNLHKSISKLHRDKPIITCCASGMRSATAKNILQHNGFSEVYNGGSWTSVKSKIK